jgi:hypothetical protein
MDSQIAKFKYILIFFLFFSCDAIAQKEQYRIPVVIVKAPPFYEEIRNTVETASIDGLAGITVGRLDGNITKPEIEVFGINNRYKTLCFFIERSSGTYVAFFNIPNPMKGERVRFLLASYVIEKMEALKGELATKVQGSKKDDCVDSDPLLIANWFPFETNGSKQLAVLINSLQASYVTANASGVKWIDCNNLSDQINSNGFSMIAFDTVCLIDLTSNCGKEVELTIRRKDGKIQRDPIKTKVSFPCQ